jgi:hypothetical protein
MRHDADAAAKLARCDATAGYELPFQPHSAPVGG